MYITERSSGEKMDVEVLPATAADLKKITIKAYFFNWKALPKECRIFKLLIIGQHDILGLMALTDHPGEERTEIKLLTASRENVGSNKRHDRITGCLLAFAAHEALMLYLQYPCISLIPKANLKQKYIEKYGMIDGGVQVYLEDSLLMELIDKYWL